MPPMLGIPIIPMPPMPPRPLIEPMPPIEPRPVVGMAFSSWPALEWSSFFVSSDKAGLQAARSASATALATERMAAGGRQVTAAATDGAAYGCEFGLWTGGRL